jgi:hypothetical protein
MDLISTLSVVLPIFGIVLVLSIGIAAPVVWLWDRRKRSADPHGPLSDWFDSYAEPEHADAKERMDTLMRPADAPRTAWIDELLHHYQLLMEIDSDAGVVLLTDHKFFELKKKTIELPVSKVLGADYQQAKALLRTARFNLNRRAQRAGLIPVKHRKSAVAA